ncbi:YGGT family protein [Candidatus Desulfosporosinus infrequens]|uniref:YGGT family protein n=1 Tax=Candidatus Desulfosporosinus infrequens TaxID=2043169 RepID=A0A2U3JXF3_9FIRM|nr:YGGT family protein [Candidatus Desulfosporosinus infrequens]
MISLIAQVIDKVITILIFAIVIRTFLSFIPQLKSNQLISLLYDVTDPLLKPFQRFQIGGAAMALDLSPLIAIIVLNLIQSWIVRPFF